MTNKYRLKRKTSKTVKPKERRSKTELVSIMYWNRFLYACVTITSTDRLVVDRQRCAVQREIYRR